MTAPPAPDAPLRWRCSGCEVAYSTAADGDTRQPPARAALLARWRVPVPAIVPRQVHGTRVARVEPGQDPGEADGLVTTAAVALGIFGADCPGLVLVAGDAMGVAHCGWRGCAGGIVAVLVEALRTCAPQVPPRHWAAFIGPGIGGEDYEVDAPVLAARTWPPAALTWHRPGHALLDLRCAISADLRAAGISRIDATSISTRRDPRLHSYRGQGRGPTQLLLAWKA